MDNYANESVLLFGDEKLTAIYQDIVTQYNRMIQLSGRYELCPYQYAQFVMAAITIESNFGIFNGAENHHEVEMSILHQDIPQYAATNKYRNALKLYDDAVRLQNKGWHFIAIEQDGSQSKYVIL